MDDELGSDLAEPLDQPLRPPARNSCPFWKVGALLGSILAVVITVVSMLLAEMLPKPRIPVASAHGEQGSLLVSFHGDHRKTPNKRRVLNQILRWSLDPSDPQAPGEPVLDVGDENPHLLRCMVQDFDGSLLVANAYVKDSRILRYGDCSADSMRQFVETVASHKKERLLVHPYGIALSGMDLFVTTQDTGAILRYSLRDTGESPTSYVLGRKADLRGLVQWKECVFAAEKKGGVVYRMCGGEGLKPFVAIRKPIGLAVDPDRQLLLVGSRYRKDPKVVAFDLSSPAPQPVKEFRYAGMTHPAGLAIASGGRLIVAAQNLRRILEFDIESGVFRRVLVESLPDDPECLLVSSARC